MIMLRMLRARIRANSLQRYCFFFTYANFQLVLTISMYTFHMYISKHYLVIT